MMQANKVLIWADLFWKSGYFVNAKFLPSCKDFSRSISLLQNDLVCKPWPFRYQAGDYRGMPLVVDFCNIMRGALI